MGWGSRSPSKVRHMLARKERRRGKRAEAKKGLFSGKGQQPARSERFTVSPEFDAHLKKLRGIRVEDAASILPAAVTRLTREDLKRGLGRGFRT